MNITPMAVPAIVVNVNGSQRLMSLAEFDNGCLTELKQVFLEALGQQEICCAKRAALEGFIAAINDLLNRRAVTALCRN